LILSNWTRCLQAEPAESLTTVNPATNLTHPWRGYILIAAASFCWGASATFGKALFSGRLFGEHTHISPLVLSQARTTFAVLLLCAFLLARYGRSFFRMARRDFALCLLVGTLGLAGSNYFYYLAIQKSTVALAITLQYTAPLWVLITMVLRGRERFTILRVSSVFLAMIGIALTIGLFSGGIITPEDVNNSPGFKEKVKVVFCSCGSRENPGNINSNHEALDKVGVKNTAYVSPDTAHEFLTWRRSLHEFAPLLFQ